MKLRQALIGVCFSAVFVVACSAPSEDAADSPENRADPAENRADPADNRADPPENAMRKPETIEERREARRELADRNAKEPQVAERVQDDDADHIGGEVPDEILDKIIADLMTKTGAASADIEVIRAESLIWNDGSLGCGKPGQMYTHALVPGYRVILGHQGQQFDYRAREKGYFMLCEQPTLAAPGAGTEPPVQ